METTLTLSEAKARFSEVVERAVQGEVFVITRMGARRGSHQSFRTAQAKAQDR